MEDETKTCFDCDFVYYSSKDDKWYCERPREGYPIREVDPNSPACNRFYEEELYMNIEHCSTCYLYRYCWSLYHAICNRDTLERMKK